MTRLFGRDWSEEDLRKRTGLIEQLGGVRLAELADGIGRGVRIAQLRTGGGLNVTVLLDRGLDIYDAEWRGIPLSWVSPTGPTHPAYFDPHALGWRRSFFGGLMLTCGMTTMGAPSVDKGQELGLHGRISNLPATNVQYGGRWENGEYVISLEGEVRETVVFGENLLLSRRLEAHLGAAELSVHDIVTNEGYQPTPHMMLYHINAGFPVVDEGSRLIAPSRNVLPRDDIAAPGTRDCARFSAPIPGFQEQVYFHEMVDDTEGYVTVALVNPRLEQATPLGFYVKYPHRELPCFNEWKMMDASIYSVGMEPATNWVEGRARARELGTLQILQPGEQRHYHLKFGVVSSAQELADLEEKTRLLSR